MSFQLALPFSEGETKMHDLLKAPHQDNPTVSGLTMQAAQMLQRAPLLAIGTLDEGGRPWTSLWGGETGFAGVVGPNLIGAASDVDARYDPVVQALLGGRASGELVQEEQGKGRMISGLTLNLEMRKRVKLFGRMVAGALSKGDDESSADVGKGSVKLVVNIEQSLGNCPKYLNKKRIEPAVTSPALVSDLPVLTAQACALIDRADTFFLSSSNEDKDMDTNIRGGPPGFVRVLSNAAPGSVLVWPEYSGNRLYQSLGNLQITPRAGLIFPDFTSGDVLYVTGDTEILVGTAASAIIPRSNLAVRLAITGARFVSRGLPFRGVPGELSPYNPPVRRLAAEGSLGARISPASDTATLVEKKTLAPGISRYRFKTSSPALVSPGQWAALDFSPELDLGYSHMRDDDPSSLNDDFVRTFTVSSTSVLAAGGDGKEEKAQEFEITVRRHGPVTAFLASPMANVRGLVVPLRGFGGDFTLNLSPESMAKVGGVIPFVAGGVGITPLLAHLPLLQRLVGERSGSSAPRLRLFWAARASDLPFVVDTLETYKNVLVSSSGEDDTKTSIFISSSVADQSQDEYQKKIDQARDLGARVELRRIMDKDLRSVRNYKDLKWHVCAGGELRKLIVREWLAGVSEVMSEDFEF